MNALMTFLSRMDKSAWRSIIVTSLLLLGVLGVLIAGRVFVFSGETGEGMLSSVQTFLEGLRHSPFALVFVIGFFCLMAFFGAPQFGLMGAVVLAFGPVLGFFYAWFATLCSASLTFWVGRLAGMDMVRRYGGDSIQRLSRFMGRNAFLASGIVRNVPTAPFIVVNMAFGASEAKYTHFVGGAALGIIPKILLTALFGQAIASSLSGNPWFAAVAVIAMALLWIGIMLFARSRLSGAGNGSSDAP